MKKRIERLIIVFVVAWCSVGSPLTALALDDEPSSSDQSVHKEESETSPPLSEQPVFEDAAEVPPAPAMQMVAPATNTPSSDTAELSPAELPPLIINRVAAGKPGQAAYEYIEIFNPSASDATLDSWHIHVLRKEGDSASQDFVLRGTVRAHGYVLIAGTDSELDSLSPDFRLRASSIVTTGGIIQLVDDAGTVVEQLRWGDTVTPSLSLVTNTALTRVYTDDIPSMTGDNMTDFNSQPLGGLLPRGGGYLPEASIVHRCVGVLISEVAANAADEAQFIELYNDSSASVVLDGCLLQTNRSTTKSIVLTGTVQPQEYKAFFIANTELTLTKTTSGIVYILSSDGQEETDARSYDELAGGTSWSWFGGSDWRQTFSPTPDEANSWQEFLPCEAGYERSSETGRCRKVAADENIRAECAPGQYRNAETNRCRNVDAADVLVACQAGQYRNPETNRCRTLASATSELVPCREGQVRNPETNRCRNETTAIPSADFAVEPVAEAGKAFAGWWALGGIGLLAAGYGAWEWRHEVVRGIQKVAAFFTSSK